MTGVQTCALPIWIAVIYIRTSLWQYGVFFDGLCLLFDGLCLLFDGLCLLFDCLCFPVTIMRVYSPEVSLQEAISSLLSGSEPSSTCSLSFGNSDGRLQVSSFDIDLSGYSDAMRSYKLVIGIRKANGKDLNSYSGAVLFSTSVSTYSRSQNVTFVLNESTKLYETIVYFDDNQYSSVKVLLQASPGTGVS